MEKYLLVGLVFYLLAMLANNDIFVGWKRQPLITAFSAALFILAWFPVLLVSIYISIRRRRNERYD